MNEYSGLYNILVKMEEAAAKVDKAGVCQLNKAFSPEYDRVMQMPYDEGSLPDLYDKARNKLINAIDDLISPTPKDKKAELEEARKLISRIVKSGR
jgi:hypothetical protein